MIVNELDRVLNGENMSWTLTVNLVEKSGECSGFARAGRTGNKDQTVGSIAKFDEWNGKVELIDGNDIKGYGSKDNGDAVTLIEYIDAKAREPLDAEREIYLVPVFEVGFLWLTHEAVRIALCVFGGETRVVREFAQFAINSNARR